MTQQLLIAIESGLAIGHPSSQVRLTPSGIALITDGRSETLLPWADVECATLHVSQSRAAILGPIISFAFLAASVIAGDSIAPEPEDGSITVSLKDGSTRRHPVRPAGPGGYARAEISSARSAMTALIEHPEFRPLLEHPQTVLQRIRASSAS